MRPTYLILLLLGIALITLLPNALATNVATGPCGGVGIVVTATPQNGQYWWFTTNPATPPSSSGCFGASIPSLHATEGTCETYTVGTGTIGAGTATAPTGIHLYLYPDLDGTNHAGPSFAGALRDVSLSTSLPATASLCYTKDGTSTGASAPGGYRIVLRVCQYVNPAAGGCSGTTRTMDINSDMSSNLPPTGDSIVGQDSGGKVADAVNTCARDSANGPAGADTTTYVGGDVPTVAWCFHAPIHDYALQSQLVPTSTGSAVNLASATWSASGTGTFVTTGVGTTNGPITLNDALVSGTTYTQRLTFPQTLGIVSTQTSRIHYASLASGVTSIAPETAEAPWGTVDKTLTATCVPRDPNTGSSTLAPAKLSRGEQLQCRGAGPSGQAQIQNARGEDWPTGAFLSVIARRESQAPMDTTDAPRCDATTTLAGAYQCDVTLRASTYTNNVVTGGATLTASLGYGADVAIYQESSRVTLLARAHIANLFDVDPKLRYASTVGACDVAPAASLPVAQRGQVEALSFKLCNARGQLVTPTGSADATREDTYVVDQGSQALAPTSGTYAWSFTANGASAHTITGYAKRVNFTDGLGNNATASSAYNVTDLLNVAAFHTWLKTCTGPESSLFVAAADTICANEGPVTSATGAPWTAAKTFVRWYNDTPDNAQLASDSQASVTATTSTDHQIVPQPPAGTWTFTVRAYDANGNYGEATKSITIVSPLTSIYDILCSGTNLRIEPGGTLTAICTTMKRDPQTYVMEPYCPDASPYYRVNYTTSDGAWHAAVATTTPASDTNAPCSYWVNWTVPADWPEGRPAELLINANMTGAPIHAFYPLNIETTKGADPAFATADYSWDTHAATVSVSLKFGNGTARSGIAPQIQGQLYAPDDTTATATLTFTERATTGTYYARVPLGISPSRGTWLAVITAPQPSGTGFTSSAATFTISENLTLRFVDERDLSLALWTSLNATLEQLERRVNDTTNATLDSLAYTRELLNHTSTITPNTTLQVVLAADDGTIAYAGRPAKLEGNADATGPGAFGAWFWTWDYGDNTTGLGTPSYHAWTKPGNYTVHAFATSALGNTTSITLNVTVILSRPFVEIRGPTNVTMGERAAWTIGTTRDPHDELAATDWEADPTDVDGWLVGHQHLNKGWCTNCTTYPTTFLAVGDHALQLTARNAHGITNTTTITVHVHAFPKPAHGGTPIDVGQDDLAKANENARGFMETIHQIIRWLTG